MNLALADKDFITQLLTKQTLIEQYVQIKLLDFNTEEVNQTLTGVATSGSFNIDGKSAVRRSCNFSLAVDFNTDFIEEQWGLHSKISAFIGIKNYINSKYDDIIWFPMGVYVLTNFSCSSSVNSLTINIQGKDKMCLLDGTISGALGATTDFGTIDILQDDEIDGDIINQKIPIRQIITEAVHKYGQENYSNIIINDLEDYGLALQMYRGEVPFYMLIRKSDTTNISTDFYNLIWDENYMVKVKELNKRIKISSSDIKYYNLTKEPNKNASVIILNNQKEYYVSKYEYGDNFGYKVTDLVYAGNLIANVGETIVSVLDKIKNMLGEYEYFYNLYGQFVFQKKKNYLQGNYETLISDRDNRLRFNTDPYYSFVFTPEILTSLPKNPQIAKVKNDYILWGKTLSANGNQIPIHARIALDIKPVIYNSIEITEDEAKQLKTEYPENYPLPFKHYMQSSICYTVGKEKIEELYDYNKDNELNNLDVLYLLAYYMLSPSDLNMAEGDLNGRLELNPYTNVDVNRDGIRNKNDVLALAKLISEQEGYIPKAYHLVDWREIIYQMALDYYKYHSLGDLFLQKLEYYNPWFIKGNTGYQQYYEDLQGFWRYLYNPTSKERYDKNYNITYDKDGWNPQIWTSPETLTFWFDFIEPSNGLTEYSIKKIGDRTLFKSDNNSTAIFYKENPDIILYNLGEKVPKVFDTDYIKIQVPDNFSDLFTISSKGQSAVENIYTLINKNLLINDTITLSSIPIYSLEPNTRIQVINKDLKLYNDYIVNSISIPLQAGGVSSIQAYKVNPDLITI